jgi:hypothetical protein
VRMRVLRRIRTRPLARTQSLWELGMNIRLSAALVAVAFSAAACEVSKSSNPLSPSVAGPIAGVSIAQPNAIEPGQDWQIYMRDQPVRLLFQNATTTGVRPITYTVEIATDAAFTSVVFKRTGIAGAQGDTTSVQLPDALATGRTYWWHVRAEDGANAGDFSAAKSFVAVAPVNLGAPTAKTPNGTVTTLTPSFKVGSGSESGPFSRIVYTLQVANDAAFTSVVATLLQDETPPETTVAQNFSFLNNKSFYWRVQARDTGDSLAVSPWSATQTFATALPVATPSGGGGTAGAPCGPPYPNNGPAVINCVAGKYPQYLVAGVSVSQRIANMQFLRDRVIETGKCGGMDLGLNLKRGGPEISNDFIVWVSGGVPHGVDIGAAYDDPSVPLRMTWSDAGPNGGFPFYKDYGPVSCK